MAEEKQQLSLSDLGIEKEETPAMKVANQKANEKKEESKNSNTVVVNSTESVEQVVVSKPAKKPVSYAPVHNNTSKDENPGPRVLKPDYENFRTVEDVNEIAKIKYDPTDKYVKAVRKNQQDLMELADKGIERTVKEMTAPGGRIDQAKHEYVKHKYDELIKRAKSSKQLTEKIRALENIMDSDARFDDASEYEKKGFVLWRIANDDTVETNDDYFGIKANKEAQKQRMVRNSHDARLELDKLNEEPMEDIYDDSKTFSVSSNDPVIPFKETKKKDKKEEKNNSITLEESPTADSELAIDEEEKKEDNKSDITPDIEIDDSFDDDEEDFQLSDEEQKKIINQYKDELETALGINKISSLEGFSISSKSIKLNNALEGSGFKKTTTWGLQFAAEPIEMTALSGEELITLNPHQTSYDTVAGLRTVFSIIYRHIANPKKPEFETWLKQISDYDVDSLLFGVYVANFKDTNIVTYQCPNKKCQNVFVKKLDVMDMLKFPNDEVKENFLKVLRKDTEGTSLYRTHPVAINDRYAFGFVTQSAYSSLFEPASLSEEFSKKYKPIIDIMPNIDTIYKIDQVNRTLIPISFGEGNNFQNTVMRKVKGIATIMKSFTPDERAIVVSEAGKISLTFSTDKIQYCIPETTCPHCGEIIPETTATPLDLLFTRAQLPIIAASIQE